jgi:hypothetical protein
MIQDFMTYDGLAWFMLQVGRNPDRLFSEWLSETTNLIQGCIDLGIDPPEEGPELLDRIKAAVSPALLQRCMINKENTARLADTPEPFPVPNDRPAVWSLVIADMMARDREGRRKYGTPLQPFNGRDALVDAYQEALDLAVYLRQAIAERDGA